MHGSTADTYAEWWMLVSIFSHVVAATRRPAVAAAANQSILCFILSDTYEGLLQLSHLSHGQCLSQLKQYRVHVL